MKARKRQIAFYKGWGRMAVKRGRAVSRMKRVGALKSTILIFNKLGYPKTAEFVKQTIAEYDTQTKS